MRFGVCSWILGDEKLEATAAFLAEAGFDGLELEGDLPSYEPVDVNVILDDNGLAVLSLTPADVDLAHPDVAVRAEAVDYYLRLLDFAAAVGSPMVCCHGAVGRVRAVTSQDEEYGYLVDGVQCIGLRAAEMELVVAMEVLNRYESHLLNTAAQAVSFVRKIGLANVGILLDAYHMNIEEADPVAAVLEADGRLVLFHAADSNRQAVGRGHSDFLGLMRALRRVDYSGDIIIECTAAGPDPFTPVKSAGWREEVGQYAVESLRLLQAYASVAVEL